MCPPQHNNLLLSKNSLNWRASGERLPPDCKCHISDENTICCTLYNHFRFAALSSMVDNGLTVHDELGCLQLCVNRST